ncbi:GMC oxidoreductase [Aquimarina sp. 2201CG5-10]|uniref:GMC oxidoreductase n=1 Tax=Aquimarina callyspongiae TaxID=3098150 RepID=UPI002AB4FF59|nr:GMC oxidoreductase [Aquimarina sp. 2201CG5-10]MDY8135202.1 GMC oxidoreductase [Aquimarina sp. 2201CG5-10]
MIKYGQDIPTGTELSTQVCVVGSGAAGVTLAWYLQKAGKKVILIDGSRDMPNDPYEDKILLYNGEATGLFKNNEPEFLIRPTSAYQYGPWERERTYGGTTTHWGGQSRPLDPITFEGVPGYTGWPVTRKDLDLYFDEAVEYCKLASTNFEADYWAKVLGAEVPRLNGFNTEMYQFMGNIDSNLDFAKRKVNGQTIGDTSVEVIRNASLLTIEHDNGSANRLHVASISSSGNPPTIETEFYIKADAYVLATGAVANARQLLLSEIDNDNIGRYFMCHPLVASYLDGGPNPVTITGNYLNYSEQRLMDGNDQNGMQWKDENGVTVQGRFIPNEEKTREFDIGRCWFWANGGSMYFEQAPNKESRITLSENTDKVFGQRQTHINWEFNDLDEKTYKIVTRLFRKAVKDINNNADVNFVSWENIKSRAVVNGHHLGTTRMSDSPEDGVVDKNLRSHDVDNLYVAGSSVWPSAGISNPTFTIITFSIRLAKHLINKVL